LNITVLPLARRSHDWLLVLSPSEPPGIAISDFFNDQTTLLCAAQTATQHQHRQTHASICPHRHRPLDKALRPREPSNHSVRTSNRSAARQSALPRMAAHLYGPTAMHSEITMRRVSCINFYLLQYEPETLHP
jgi:hypothetical protein